MKFLLDANLPQSLGYELQKKFNFDCKRAEGLLSDENIYKLCKNEGRILLTLDTDFFNLQKFPPQDHPGIIVFRVSQQGISNIKKIVHHFFESLAKEEKILKGNLISVREDKFRIYKQS